ncbi:alpha/beta hydrolase [Qipengyuania sp. JC766]|uniref:alpha/beta fold hydrolase n=1 Tax=Qipengyuania sp. JC766 TaxID=3232139 RepID=UPI00345AE963
MASEYTDASWTSEDGLKLHYRDYAGDAGQLPVCCFHGLTRNARDFSDLAAHIAPSRRVIVPEMRGRADSDYAPDPATYNPVQYVRDVLDLLERESIDRFVAIGTSLGGLMTMMLAHGEPGRIEGAVLNDIGPDISADGIAKIRSYVGQGRSFPTWLHAARSLEDVHGDAHPGFELEDWLEMAKRGMTVQQNGRIGFDYDMKIAEPFSQEDGAAPADLWPALDALSGIPVLIVRGDSSNILSPETLERMVERLPQARTVTIANTGHAPLLSEPPALAAIDELLGSVP